MIPGVNPASLEAQCKQRRVWKIGHLISCALAWRIPRTEVRASWPQKMDAKAAGSWSGLPELSTATLCCLQDVHLKQKDTGSSKAKGQKKLYYSNTNQKKSGKLHEYLTR